MAMDRFEKSVVSKFRVESDFGCRIYAKPLQ